MANSGKLIWHAQATIAALDEELATFVADQLREALTRKGQTSLAVSGGRTPAGFLRKLANQPLDWSHVTITLVDERWVPADHADSNARLVRETLLQGPASSACFIPFFNAAPSACEGQSITEQQLARLNWPLDVIVLGMGDDGHTASLFPQAPELQSALDSTDHCLAMTPVTAPHARISLTRAAIVSTKHLLLHICGTGKRELLEKTLAGPAPGLPIRQVIEAAPATHIFWAP